MRFEYLIVSQQAIVVSKGGAGDPVKDTQAIQTTRIYVAHSLCLLRIRPAYKKMKNQHFSA